MIWKRGAPPGGLEAAMTKKQTEKFTKKLTPAVKREPERKHPV
jgi:hypothetical protein